MNDLRCPELQGRRILVVDDDPDTREMLAVLLAASGAVVETAESAAAALEVCQRAPPDVLISDIGIPGQDGFSLMRQLRALPPSAGGGVPAIALTGYDGEADRVQAAREGFLEQLTKPVPVEAVLAAVVRALGSSLARGEQPPS